jgi:hypothetical protein
MTLSVSLDPDRKILLVSPVCDAMYWGLQGAHPTGAVRMSFSSKEACDILRQDSTIQWVYLEGAVIEPATALERLAVYVRSAAPPHQPFRMNRFP